MKTLFQRFGFLTLVLVAVLGMAQAQSSPNFFNAELSGDNVVPAVETDASGYAVALLVGNTLHVGGSYSGLSTPVATAIRGGVHVHMAAPGENGPIAFDLSNTAGTNGTFQGEFELNDEQMQALMDGMLYVQLHTEMNNPGELRGTLMPANAMQ